MLDLKRPIYLPTAAYGHFGRSDIDLTWEKTDKADQISKDAIEKIVEEHFDLRPKSLINMLDLKRPIYLPTAAYGHFGRTDIDLSWEKTDKASEISQ